MKKHHHLLLFSIIAISVVVLLTVWVKRPKKISVDLVTVERGNVQRTVTNTRAGTLKACRRAGLSPAIGGQIDKLPIKEGDHVKQGQLLLGLWNDDLVAQVSLAKSEILASQSRATQSCVMARVAKREAARLRALLKKGLTSDDKAERAIGDAEARKAACEAAKSTVEVSKARLAVAEASLERTRLLAPFDGIVAEVSGELGEFVTPSPVGLPTPPAVDIIDNTCLYVLAPIDEVDAPEIKTGMPARISFDAYNKKFFKGNVRRIAPYVFNREKQARTVDVEVNFIQEDNTLNMLPGYSADVEIILDAHENVVRIPTEALLEGNKVFIYDADDEAIYEHDVKTGLSNWKFTEIIDGVKAGERIVLSIDRDGVKDGALVKIDNKSKEKKK